MESPVPFGLTKVKPHHMRDTAKIVGKNRDNLNYAKNIILKGVCDGCALGVSGLQDQTFKWSPHVQHVLMC